MTVRPPRTYRVVGLGCKVNQYEQQELIERLEAAGLTPAPDGEPAGLCVVNSCAVTASAGTKSLDAVRKLRDENPGAKIVLAGCLVDFLGKTEAAGKSGADFALLQAEKLSIPGIEAGTKDGIGRFDGHSRAFLKVQDGCAAGCTYCIVPTLRGRPRSRPLPEIREEARRLAADGRREIVICGTHLGFYGRDLASGGEVADVVEAVLDAAPAARVRISSLEATEVSPKLLALAAGEPRVCPHFHLPLQSGDDGVLRAMGRRYTAAEFLRITDEIRSRLELPAITTDVMVGFPGEDESAFAHTLELCRRAGFSRLHVFQFSPRKGTPAVSLPGRIVATESRRRAGELRELGAELAAAFAATCVGRIEAVLAERGTLRGLPAGYTERYVRVGFRLPPGTERRVREIYRVKVERSDGPDVFGTVT